MREQILVWFYGLLAAVVGGIASGIVVYVADPVAFADWTKLGKTALALGVLNAAMYLKQRPIPEALRARRAELIAERLEERAVTPKQDQDAPRIERLTERIENLGEEADKG